MKISMNNLSVTFSGIYNIQQKAKIDGNLAVKDDAASKNDERIVEIPKGYVPPYKINPAIYAIDKDGNYTKYPSQVVASKTLGITSGCISRCINADAGKTHGLVFVSALDIEKLDPSGNVVVNNEKILDLSKKLSTEDAYYVIAENGSFQRFSSPEETSEMTGVELDVLTKGFTGYKKVVDGYTFVKAKNIESKNEDGDSVLDEEKIITVFIGNRRAFFVIDRKGKTTLCDSHTQAYNKFDSSTQITKCLNGRIKNVNGYTCAKPTEVLCVNDKNKIEVSKEKVALILAERFKK